MSKFTDQIEKHYRVKYVGYYDIPGRSHPIYVFYTENPDRSKGHSNYLGVFWHGDALYLTDAKTIEDAEYNAIEINGKFIASRYRHDYQSEGDAMIDGGLDYVRLNPAFPVTHTIKVRDGKEVFEPIA